MARFARARTHSRVVAFGLLAVPFQLGKTRSPSAARPSPSLSRWACCCVQCSFSSATTDGGILMRRRPFSASTTNVGFSVDAGVEWKFSYWLPANWSWKLEYLYVDLESLDAATPLAGQIATFKTLSLGLAETITTHTHFTDNIVRVGLNYQFH